MPRALLLAALVMTLPAHAPPAQAQVRRCELPTGQTVYTDRRCDAIGAVERRAAPPQARLRSHRPGCARSLRDLHFEVAASIEAGDVNRLAGLYHWTGMGTRQAYDVMQRLQAIVDRPFVDLQPVYAGDDPYPVGRAPIGFRIDQVSARGSTPVRVGLGLRKHLDCWWITLGGARARPPATASEAASSIAPALPAGEPAAAHTPPH